MLTCDCGVSDAKAPRVLIGVANGGKRNRLARALERAGCEVVDAPTGYDVLTYLADALLDDATRPDAIVLDAVMRGCTGLSLVHGLRELLWTTPIVVIAQPGSALSRHEARALGANSVLCHSSGPARVTRAVQRLLHLPSPDYPSRRQASRRRGIAQFEISLRSGRVPAG